MSEKEELIHSLNEDEKFYKIFKKLNDMESYIMNLIHPIQCLNKLIGPERMLHEFAETFSRPIKIDGKELFVAIKNFREDLENYSNRMNLKALIDSFMSISNMSLQLKNLNECMREMQEKIESIHENGFTVNIAAVVEKNIPLGAEEPKKPKKNKGRR